MKYTLTVEADNASELAALLTGISGGSVAPKPAMNGKAVKIAEHTPAENIAQAAEPMETAVRITKEALRELTTEKAQADAANPAKIKAILKKLGGATQVANLGEEHYASYHEQVAVL